MYKKNLALYVTPGDYQTWAGPDWPTYQQYIQGGLASDPEIQQEIDQFTQAKVREGVRFPILTAPACQSKWTWSTLWLNEQSSSSCHRAGKNYFDLENFDDFHNLPKKIQDREKMLQGQWPESGGCSYCREIEQAGGWSDRMHNNEIRGLTPPELEIDQRAVRVSPRLVEIFAYNTCNMSCLYCNANLSSKIQNENSKFGDFYQQGVGIPAIGVHETSKEFLHKFLNWLERNISTLKRLHLLGGETFLQHNLIQPVLDVIEQHPNPDLELCLFSNLMVPEKIWNQYMTRIRDLHDRRCIKIFDLTASIDCWGAEAEFVRWGLDLKLFEQRLQWAAHESQQWLRLTINQTICSLTMRTMPDLICKIIDLRRIRPVGHFFEFVDWHGNSPPPGGWRRQNVADNFGEWLHPKWFGWKFWQSDVKRILDVMPRRDADEREAFKRLDGIFALLRDTPDPDAAMINRLHVYLDEMDRRRGTRWREIFPYLDTHV